MSLSSTPVVYNLDLNLGCRQICIVSRYINRGSAVFGCLLDVSKAFNLVNHDMLFHKLVERGLPLPVVRFLSSWYDDHRCV